MNCLRNTGWPQASPVSLRMHICATSAINNYCVHANYYCLRKQLALVRIPQAMKWLIVTLTHYNISIAIQADSKTEPTSTSSLNKQAREALSQPCLAVTMCIVVSYGSLYLICEAIFLLTNFQYQ